MKFLYNKDAGLEYLNIESEAYKYLFRVRRFKQGDIIELRNLQDDILYSYKIDNVSKKSATLRLLHSEKIIVLPKRTLIIGWCIIDPKVVEKTIPMLNEIGVTKIVFIKCAYSQANFKINIDRVKKIAINSSQQCGRNSLIEFEFSNSLSNFLEKYPQSYMLNFSKQTLESVKEDINSIVIGCEGGFSNEEIKLIKEEKIIGLDTPLILRSETAVVTISSKILI